MSSRYAGRRQKLWHEVKSAGADGILVSDFTNVSWLTGFSGDDSAVVVTRNKTVIISDSRYETQLQDECPDIEAVIRNRTETIFTAAAQVIHQTKLKGLAFEGSTLTVADYRRLQEGLASVDLVSVEGIVEGLRAIKDAQEVEETRRAVWLAERGFAALKATLRPDQTERDVAFELEHTMRKLGAKGASFPVIVAVGPRAALPHARPTDVLIGESDFVLVDWGAEAQSGYRSDLTRVLITGKLSPKLEKVYGVVLRAQQAGIEAVKPGATCGQVDLAARQIIEQAGFGKQFGHGLGHGVGLDIHEQPRVRNGVDTILRPGMVITIEPGIYLPGWGGVRIEDDVLVTKQDHEVLTSVPKQLTDVFVH